MDRLKDMLAQDQQRGKASRPAGGKAPANPFAAGPRDVWGTPDGRICVVAKTIKRALERASEVLEESIMNLDYEILEHGANGFLGMGGKPYKLVVGKAAVQLSPYDHFTQTDQEQIPDGDVDHGHFAPHVHHAPEPANKPGEVKVIVRKTGVFLVVMPPRGSGNPATVEQANSEVFMRDILSFDKGLIARAVSERSGEPVKIGEWAPNEAYDSRCQVEVTPDEMKAFVTVTKPIKSGRQLEFEDIQTHLDFAGVKFGMQEEAIRALLENGTWNVPVLVAKGKPVEHGQDGTIQFFFRTDNEKVQLKEEDGERVDYRNLDLVQNVVVGQVLARKEPASVGTPGRTVTNKRLEAKSGKEIPFLPGHNCHLSEDNMEVISDINGQVMWYNNKVHVEPVYQIPGDVNLETGNIVFLGNVIIGGSVEDNFSVKAAGNVEVRGTVGKSVIEAEGNVVVKQGILGKDGADIKAGNDVMAKFVEHAKLSAGNDVIILEAIIHSKVDAGKRVLCVGKKACIAGGRIRAREEVNAKEIGSKASAETIVEVGIDPKKREKLNELEEEKREAMERVRNLSKDIITLQNQKGSGVLSEEKEKMLQDYILEKGDLEARLKEVNDEINEIRAYLNMLESKGKICASKMVYPGTRVVIKNAVLDIKDNFKFVTFVQEAGNIKVNPYEEYDIKGKPPTAKR